MWIKIVRTAHSKSIMLNALQISLVVGSLLNLINQAEPLLANAGVNWLEFFVNYLIPYCVASYSAARNQIAMAPLNRGINAKPSSHDCPDT